jgi:hypothetical protein
MRMTHHLTRSQYRQIAALIVVYVLVGMSPLTWGADPSPPQSKAKPETDDNAAPDEAGIARLLNSPSFTQSESEHFFTASGLAYSEGAVERAALLFYLGQIRAAIDLKAYKPTETGGNSPVVAISALTHSLGAYINPAVMRNREMFARVVGRVAEWTPTYSPTYSPGWKHDSEVSKAEFESQAQKIKTHWLNQMNDTKRLLEDDEYFRLVRLMQDFNFRSAERMPWDPLGKAHRVRVTVTQAEYDAAESRIKEIEKRLEQGSLSPTKKGLHVSE